MSEPSRPWGLKWRSKTFFILATVAIGLFTDLFLYGLVVPILPYILQDRIGIPQEQTQSYVSALLAAYAGASVIASVPAGWVADRTKSRQAPFLCGLAALLAATLMLAFGRSIAVLVVARVLQGVSAGVVWAIGLAMVLDTVGPENLGKVIGSIFSFISIGELLAPVLGGVLYDKTGYPGVWGVAGGILGIDFIMRLLIVEKKTAAKFDDSTDGSNPRDFGSRENGQDNDDNQDQEANESSTLLNKNKDNDDSDEYIVKNPTSLEKRLPILYCFRSPRLIMGLLLSLVQATLLASYDATVPTQAQSLFGFSPLQAGLLFIALDIPYLLIGPLAGWGVDKYGTKPIAVIGFSYLVPALVLLRLPEEGLTSGEQHNIILYYAVLAINGVGLGFIGSPSIVEASDVVQKFDKANPEFFGEQGPYAQLYGFTSLFFSAGLTIGPVVGGLLRDSIGYGNMNAVFAAVSGLTAVGSWYIIGGKPKAVERLQRR